MDKIDIDNDPEDIGVNIKETARDIRKAVREAPKGVWIRHAINLFTMFLLVAGGYLWATANDQVEVQRACNDFVQKNYQTPEMTKCLVDTGSIHLVGQAGYVFPDLLINDSSAETGTTE